MLGLISKLKEVGAEKISDALNLNNGITIQAIQWVKNESGIDLYSAGPNGENLTTMELSRLKDIDLKFNIKFVPNYSTSKADTAIKLVGPLSGFIMVIFCIILDSYIIYIILQATSITQGIADLNPFVTLVTGWYHAKSGEIISYWFGASQQQNKQMIKNIQPIPSQNLQK